jgi:Nup85 Nucleoporin
LLICLRKIQIPSIRNENARTGLGILLKILRGDRDTIADVSESWQEYVASMAFFAHPFALTNYKDVEKLYDDAMAYGFNIDKTLPSEVASSALFTCDLPGVRLFLFKLILNMLGACELF